MKLDVLRLPFTKQMHVSEDVTFDPEVFKCHIPLVEVKNCHVNLIVQRFEEFIYVTIEIKARVMLQCSYTLQIFEKTIHDVDELHFAPTNDEDDDCITYTGTSIEMDPYIFNLLSAAVPLAPKAPNAKITHSNDGFKVITDEEYMKQKAEQGNSQFDALKDLDFDD